MTTSYRAEIVVSAKQEATQALEQVAKSIKDVNKAAGDGKDHVKGFGDAFEKLTGVSLGAAAGVGGIALAVKGVADAVQQAAKWGDDMGDLATKTGMTVKQASTMATVFGDVGLSMGTLEAAAKAATKNGIEFNMESLKKLAAQYQAIQDPVERSQFAMKNFGRAGLEMTEILSRDAANLDELAKAASYSGKVIDEKAAAAAEKFNTTMAQFGDRVDGAKIALGNALIPTLNSAAEGFVNLVKVIEVSNILLDKAAGKMTEGEAAWRASELAAGDLTAAWKEFAPVSADVTDRVDRQTAAADASTVAWTNMAPPMDVARAAMETTAAVAKNQLEKNLDDLTGAASDLKFGMGELTTATLFNQAAQGLDADAAYALAKSMGLIKPDAEAAKNILDDLRRELESGGISAGEYQGKVKLLDMAIRSLPDGKTITVTYLEQYVKSLNADPSLGNAGGNKRQGGAVGDGADGPGGANGLDFIVPAGYPNDSFPFRAQSGERVTVTPAGQDGGSGDPEMLMTLRALPGMLRRAMRDAMAGA